MLTYYLDGQRIDAPLNLDGLTLRKSRHRTYWGFLYRKLGYVQGLANLLFQQPDAVAYLQAEFDRMGVQAETTFRIDEDGIELYLGFIDYTTWDFDGFQLSLGLRDSRAVADLEAGAATTYGLPAIGTLQLPTRRLGGTPSLKIMPALATVQRSSAAAIFVTHFVPLGRLSASDTLANGTLVDVVNPLDSGTVYRNDTGKAQLVTVSGVVAVTASSNTTTAVTLQMVVGSDRVTVFTGSVGGLAQTLTAVVNATMSVAPGGTLALMWWGDAPILKFNFTYDQALTQISLSDEASVPASVAYGLPVGQVLTSLISRATGYEVTLTSDYFTTGDGASLFLASGAGIRGLQSAVTVSLQALFTGLNKLVNLALWVDEDDDTLVHVEPKANQPKRVSSVGSPISRTRKVATDYLYNAVTVGYSTWKADSILAGDEPNGQRSYSTGITTVRNTLDLTSDLITSSNLIEQQRRLQFDPKTGGSTSASQLDQALFLICTVSTPTGLRAETRERTDYLSGVHDPATVANTRLNPARNLLRWADWLAASAPLQLEAIQGNNELVSSYDGVLVSAATTLVLSTTITPMLVTLEVPMTLDEYETLGDTIDDDGNECELLDAEWRKTETGSAVTLTLLQR